MGSSSSKSSSNKDYKDYNEIIEGKDKGINRSNKDYKDYNEIIEGKDIEINRSNKNYEDYYEIIKGIGSGGYGIVYKGREKKTNELRAIKVMDLNKIREILMFEIDESENIEEKLKSYINGIIEEFEIMKKCCINNNNSVNVMNILIMIIIL